MTGELGADIVERYNDSPIAAAALPALTSVRPPYARIVTEVLRLIEIGPGNPTHSRCHRNSSCAPRARIGLSDGEGAHLRADGHRTGTGKIQSGDGGRVGEHHDDVGGFARGLDRIEIDLLDGIAG